jgi:hypothetical protein
MTSMLPAKSRTVWNLKDVFQSAEASVLGLDNALKLNAVSSAIVVMIDGLGYDNLLHNIGFMRKHLGENNFAHCGFPSTTTSSIASFSTGVEASEHGLFGYSIFNRSTEEAVNLLSGLDKYSVLDYARVEPISARSSVKVHAVTLEEYAETGFTAATMAGAQHHFAPHFGQRLELARSIANSEPGSLVYVYIPELDKEAHRSGVGGSNWAQLFADVDRAIQMTVSKLGSSNGLLVTGDHGIVDVASSSHIFLDDCPGLTARLQNVCGDPRATYIYLHDSGDLIEAKNQLSEFLLGRALVVEPRELVGQGYWSQSLLDEDDLIPDLVLIATDDVAIFHRQFSKATSMKMVGHHGSITETEIKVPVLSFGGYSSSLLVP